MNGFDTNVFVYACERSDPRRQRVALDLIDSTKDGIMVWQVACEFIAACRKLAEQGFTQAMAWKRLTEFLDVLPLVLPNPGVLRRAQQLHLESQYSFWDATLFAACLEAGITRLYTEDVPSQRPEGLEIVNPFA